MYLSSGAAAFARDPDSAGQVWSSKAGYPGDSDYREYYRDIGYELDLDYIGPHLPAHSLRSDTGFKYYRVTGPGGDKEVYVRERAMSKAGLHSGHFLRSRLSRARELSKAMGRKPIFVAAYDAELLGHWWFEGPEWLEFLIRKTTFDQDVIGLIAPPDYLDEYPINQVVELCPSTWGRGSDNEVWVNGRNDYTYRHLHRAAGRIKKLVGGRLASRGLPGRATKQAARELLLAQSSDWPFMMADERTAPYGHARFREHMLNFIGLCRQIRSGRLDEQWVAGLESRDSLFPDICLTHFR